MENTIFFKNNALYIEGKFYNKLWFCDFGEIQYRILKCNNTKITVFMEKCVFVSPTPFLSLLLTLHRAKMKNDCTIEIILGVSDSPEKRKFLNYCAIEGFLDIINVISEVKYDVSEFKEYNVVDNKNFEKVLNARISDIAEYEIDEIVDAFIGEINESNLNVSKSQKLYMMVALRNILQELIDNVDKHAYDEEHKYFALYIRIRYSTNTTRRIGTENNKYNNYRSTTKPDEIYVHKALEIYFQDVGKGMVKSYEEKEIKYKNRPLRELVKEAFFKENFKYRPNNTSINGLAFLRKVLQEKNNYFTVYNQFEGTGAFGNADKKVNVNNIHLKDMFDDKMHGIDGQIYNFTLFDREYNKNVTPESYEKLLEIYTKPYRNLSVKVLDLKKTEMFIPDTEEIVFLLMPSYVTKNVILNKFSLVLQTIKDLKTLIVADIKDDELVLFDWVLINSYLSTFKKDLKKDIFSIEQIFVVTKSLELSGFKVKNNKLTKIYINFSEFDKKFEYLYKMKIYESRELANVLKTNPIGEYIITKGKIEWSNGSELNGYLNFDMLAADDKCFNILCRNLERILPIVGDKKLYAIDTAVERLVSSINCFRENNGTDYFGVGSVFVSGMTVQSSGYQGNTIHFFDRGKEMRKPALFFNPAFLYNERGSGCNRTYIRVGKTSRIRKKDYVQPARQTNSFLSEKEMYKILHQYAYSSILCGHLYFEKKHDLLSINLNAIMYDENTRLMEYVDNIINYSLGHYFGKDLIESDYFDRLKNACIIIYPYNHFTSSIFNKCDIAEKYSEYIVGLTPTNIIISGEDSEYAECFTEYITKKIEDYKQKHKKEKIKVVFFDTLSHTGRSKQEIYEYISSIEDITPCFVSIIDAKVNHYQKPDNFLNYMNLNIPLLGKGDTCKICLVLNKLKIFKENVIDASILATIENIQSRWAIRDIRNYNEIIKLPNFERIYAKYISDENAIYEHDDLYFVNALPLYLYITNKIKKENDFSCMDCLLDIYVETIDSHSMAFIVSLFLLEYGEHIYHSLLRKVSCFLLDYMKKSNMIEIMQMSVIALLSLNEEKIVKIVLKYIETNSSNLYVGLEGQLVFMYFLNTQKELQSNKKTTFLYNKMKSGNNRLDLYKQFHCQLKNTNGNIHNSPLMSLNEGQESIKNKRLTLASLSLLELSLSRTELSFDILYEEGRLKLSDVIDEEVSSIKENCLKNIMEIKKLAINNENLREIRTRIEKVFNAGQMLHKRLFAPYINQNNSANREEMSIDIQLARRIDFYNKNRMNKLAISFNEAYNMPTNVSNNIAAIYYIWNNMLAREIDYIFDNVGKYTSESKAVIVQGEKIAGEVNIEISVEYFVIKIYNNTEDSVENIRQKAKQRYQKEVLALLGVEFLYYENNGENTLFDNSAIVTKVITPNIQNRKGK